MMPLSECDPALVRTVYENTSFRTRDWRLSYLINTETYEELKQRGGISGIVYGVPLGASFDEFRKNRSIKSEGRDESELLLEARSIAWTALDPEAVNAYKHCLDTYLALNQQGLAIGVAAATDSAIVLRVRFSLPGRREPAHVAWQPSAIEDKVLPQTIPEGGAYLIHVPRPNKKLLISLNGTGDCAGLSAGPILLLPMPPPLPEERCIRSAHEIVEHLYQRFLQRPAKNDGLATTLIAGLENGTLNVRKVVGEIVATPEHRALNALGLSPQEIIRRLQRNLLELDSDYNPFLWDYYHHTSIGTNDEHWRNFTNHILFGDDRYLEKYGVWRAPGMDKEYCH